MIGGSNKGRLDLHPREFLRSGYLFPAIAVLAAVIIIGFGVANWILKRGQPAPFRGLASAGNYYRLLPDFSCNTRRTPQAVLEISESEFLAKTTNPFDCSKTSYSLAAEDEIDVALDRKRIGFNEGIFEKFDKEPNLMDSVPVRTELWCRPRNTDAPPIDIFALGDMDDWSLEVWRGKRGLDQMIEVYPPAVKKVTRKLVGSRLNFEADGLTLDAHLASNVTGGKLLGHAKLQLDDQLIDADVVCRSTARPGLICPVGYHEVPPHELYLAQPICISHREIGVVSAREEARAKCQNLGSGFDLTREEEWLAATKALRKVEWNSGGAKEWTKDGAIDGQPSMPFRCVFHPLPETGETIFPISYAPSEESGEGLPVEVGVRFQCVKKGLVKGVRFYRAVIDPAGFTVHLWDESGKALATAATTDPGTVPGWQTVTFAEPVAIDESRTYTASYYSAAGHASVQREGLKTAKSRGLNLTALAGGGVFMTNGGFPTNSGPETVNYGVDVIFE